MLTEQEKEKAFMNIAHSCQRIMNIVNGSEDDWNRDLKDLIDLMKIKQAKWEWRSEPTIESLWANLHWEMLGLAIKVSDEFLKKNPNY